VLQRLRPPAIKWSDKDVVSADVILKFRQIFVDPDVRNFAVIGADDVPAPNAGFGFLIGKLVLFGELCDSFTIQRLEEHGAGCIDGMSFGDLNHSAVRFVAVQQVTAERCGVCVLVSGEHGLAVD